MYVQLYNWALERSFTEGGKHVCSSLFIFGKKHNLVSENSKSCGIFLSEFMVCVCAVKIESNPVNKAWTLMLNGFSEMSFCALS